MFVNNDIWVITCDACNKIKKNKKLLSKMHVKAVNVLIVIKYLFRKQTFYSAKHNCVNVHIIEDIFRRLGQSQGLLYKHLCHFFRDSKSWRASKSLYWFKSYGNFAEWVDFEYWWSCTRNGLPCSLRSRLIFKGVKAAFHILPCYFPKGCAITRNSFRAHNKDF